MLISEYRSIDPNTAIKIAISHSIKNCIVNGWDIYELLEPKTASQVISIIRELEASGLLEIMQPKMDTINEIILKLTLQEAIINYVGNIVLDSEFVLELSRRAKTNNSELIVLSPVKPWADLDDLEKAYAMYLSCSKIFEALRKAGSKVLFYEEALRLHE
jgi:hypothetical protein